MPYQTIYVVNAKGSGAGEKAEGWTFTVDASLFTFGEIDPQRYDGLVFLAESLSSWICDELRLHNAAFDTVGSQLNAEVGRGDSQGQGFYYVHLDVEDVTMAKGDYRFRFRLDNVNAAMLTESEVSGSYSYSSGKVIPRVAPELRMHLSTGFRYSVARRKAYRKSMPYAGLSKREIARLARR